MMVTCDAPKTTRGSDCVDPLASLAHCGGRNRPCAGTCANGTCMTVSVCAFCPPGLACVNGQCDCGGRGTFCSAACFDNTQSRISCGGCPAYCPGSGQGCKAGVCTCRPGRKLCGMSCTPTDADPANCGGGGTMCPSGQKCEAGACTRNLTNACNDGKCWDVLNDEDHCGTMCRNCASDHVRAVTQALRSPPSFL